MALPDWIKKTDVLGIDPIVSEDPFDVTGRHAKEAAERAAGLQSEAAVEAARIQAAAQERGLEAMMEQLGITREQFAPFLAAGAGALPELQEGYQPQRGATQEGLEASLAEIMGGEAFGALRGERERSMQGQLAAGGLTRSGRAMEEMAAIPTSLAFDIENMLFGRGREQEISRIQGLQNLAQTGLSAAGMTGGQGGTMTQQIASQLGGIGQTQAGGVTGSAQALASGILGGQQAQAQGTQNLMSLAAMFFSDPRLKKNIKQIGKIGPLDLVEWEWIDELDDSFVRAFPTMGYLSTQVKEFYPEHVGEFGSYDVINYAAVNKELESCLL
jgi:hypothetical protein